MKKYGKSFLVTLLCAVLLLVGCGKKQPWETTGVSESFYFVVEDFAQRYLALDRDGSQYDQALDTVEAYLAGEKKPEEAFSDLQKVADYFETELTSWETVTLDEKLKDQLRDIDISPAEYEMFSNYRVTDLQQRQTDLSFLMDTFQQAVEDESFRQDLTITLAREQAIQDSFRGYYYYGSFNYWFPEADDTELHYLHTKITDQLHAYLPENAVWYTTREEAENEAMGCMDRLEMQLDQLSEKVGQDQKELYEMEQALAALAEETTQNRSNE